MKTLVALGLVVAGNVAHAQFVSGTIGGTGLGSSPGGRDSTWNIVALPTGFTPPSGQTTPYNAYVPYTAPGVYTGGGSPQTGLVYLGGTNYWIAPQASTASLQPFGVTYNWIAQQQFTVPVSGFYRFDFPGAGDNELEFYIDGSVNTTDALRPTITGGQQIGGRAGTFGSMTTFTGGAQLSAGTHTASMVLWDYGGDTGALIGSSTFAPAVANWAPGSGAGGNGTWTNSNAYWTTAADGSGTKQPWTSGVGVAYFGGTSGTVSVGGNVTVNQVYFTTGGYQVQPGGGQISYGNGGTITGQTGLSTITATQQADYGLKVAGAGTVALSGTTNVGYGKVLLVDAGNLLVNGVVNNTFGTVNVSSGNLGGTGTINSSVRGGGLVGPGLTGTAAGILAATQVNPTDGLDFSFVLTGTVPTYSNASDSVNDVLRLTGGTPFTSALTSANDFRVYFDSITDASQFALGAKFTGGFFTDADASFMSMLNDASFSFYAYGDGNGPLTYNGKNYYLLSEVWPGFTSTYNVGIGVEATTANFAGGSSLGQVTTFTVVVPEPTTIVMPLGGLACVGFLISRRKRAGRDLHSTPAVRA